MKKQAAGNGFPIFGKPDLLKSAEAEGAACSPTSRFDPLLPLNKALELSGGISRAHAYRLIRLGKYPQPVRISQHRIGIRMSELAEWVRDPRTFQAEVS